MNKRDLFFIQLLIIIFTLFSCAGTENEIGSENKQIKIDNKYKVDPLYNFNGTIAVWFQFKKAAYSVTLDDGTIDQYKVAWPEMERLGIKGTFFLATSLLDKGQWNDNGTIRNMMTWQQAGEIAATGQEIGSHSTNHMDMSKDGIDYLTELQNSRDYIETKIPGISVETFCWPHWRESVEAIDHAADYYISARSGNGIISYYLNRKGGMPGETPENMYKINAFGFLDSHAEEEWKDLIKSAYNNNSWFVSAYHGIDDGFLPEESIGWSPLSIDQFIETLTYPKELGFWMATFGNVTKYILERDKAILHIKNRSFSIELSIDDMLDDSTYNQPLSISLNKPENWPEIIIKNKSEENIPFIIKENIIYLDIFPDGEPIEIKPLLTVNS